MPRKLRDVKSRFIILACLYIWLFFPVDILFDLPGEPNEWYWWSISYYLSSQIFLALLLLLIARMVRLNPEKFFGPLPGRPQIKELAILFAFLFVVSGALDFISFYPLSWIAPEFVEWWYFDLPPVIYSNEGELPFFANLLSFVSLVFLAPLTEEVLFRGYLLQRWSHKWGMMRAILLSSLFFGIIHPDILSAIVFGIVMCLIYLRSGSLIAAILMHATWNLMVWLWALYDVLSKGPDYRYTLEEFQNNWPWGFLWILLSLIFITRFLSKGSPHHWRLPDL